MRPAFIESKYHRLVTSLGGNLIKDFGASNIYEIILQDTQHIFLTEVYNEGFNYSLTLIKTNQYKLNWRDIYNEISSKGMISLYINFGFKQTQVPHEAQEVIQSIIAFMDRWKDIKLSIEGHTDNIGTPEKNKQISLERANAVMLSLVTNGVASSRLKVKGWGETKPKSSNSTEEGRQENRRVELVRIE